MTRLPDAARGVLTSDAIAHLVTLNADGSPNVTIAWAGLDGDAIVIGTLFDQRKLHNIRRDPRVSLSFETGVTNEHGLRECLIIDGRARLTEGGAAELLQRLARVYLGPDVRFPPMDDPPPGWTIRITPERVGGIGPWA